MSLLWLRVAVLLYGVAALAVLPAALYSRPRWRHVAMPVAASGGGKMVQGAGAIGPSDGQPQQVGVMPVRK